MAKKSKQAEKLDSELVKAFDEFLKQGRIAAKGARAGKKAKALKQEIVDAMGKCDVAELPDGRRIQRVEVEGSQPAKKAITYRYWQLSEMLDEVATSVKPAKRK